MNKQLKAQYIEWDAIGLCGIIGESGSGKTSTMRFILAQLALGGTGIILADGHGRMNSTSAQTLAQSCEALQKAYVLPVAVEDAAILVSIKHARTMAQNRIDGIDTDTSHVALVIDEFVSVLGRMSKEDSAYTIDTITKFATDYRKTGVKAFISAQNWTQDHIGAASIRRSMNTKIIHRVAVDAIGLFTNDPIVKKVVPNMRVGSAYIVQASADPIKVYVPKVTTDDLKAIQNRVIPYVSLARNEQETQDTVSHDVSALQSDISHFSYNINTQKLLLKWYKDVRNCIDLGKNKTDTIYAIWGASPGSSKKYKTASKLYDYLRSKL
jgi:hypothetical protein